MNTDTTPGDWVDLVALDDLWEDAGQAVTVGDRELALFRVGDEAFATDAMCTHGLARLCEGYVEGHEVECPLHQGRFDLRTGAATCEPAVRPVAVHPVRVVGGRVQIQRMP
jgi:naphthalene 1,2-dioxygenase ferredoxin component